MLLNLFVITFIKHNSDIPMEYSPTIVKEQGSVEVVRRTMPTKNDKEIFFENGDKFPQIISFEEMIRSDRWCPPKRWLDAIGAEIGDWIVYEKGKDGYLNYVLDPNKLRDLDCDLNNGDDILNALLEKYPEDMEDLVKIKAILQVRSQGRLGAKHQLIKLFCGEFGIKKEDWIVFEYIDNDKSGCCWYIYFMKREDIPTGYFKGDV